LKALAIYWRNLLFLDFVHHWISKGAWLFESLLCFRLQAHEAEPASTTPCSIKN